MIEVLLYHAPAAQEKPLERIMEPLCYKDSTISAKEILLPLARFSSAEPDKLGFATSKPGEFDTWMVTHHPGASRVRPVSVNRQQTSRNRVEWEIETAILRR